MIRQTVEAEITAIMPLQRAWKLRAGEKQVVKWTAEGAVKGLWAEYSATLMAGVSCRGYVGISLRAWVIP